MNLNKTDIYNLWSKGEGEVDSIIHCMEEMGELTKALSKMLRDSVPFNEGLLLDIIGEMADVYICLAMLQSIFSISDTQMNCVCNVKMIANLDRISISPVERRK